MVKDFFKKKNIKFKEMDVSNKEALDEMIEKSGQMGVPVTDINGKIIVGYDVKELTLSVKNGTDKRDA